MTGYDRVGVHSPTLHSENTEDKRSTEISPRNPLTYTRTHKEKEPRVQFSQVRTMNRWVVRRRVIAVRTDVLSCCRNSTPQIDPSCVGDVGCPRGGSFRNDLSRVDYFRTWHVRTELNARYRSSNPCDRTPSVGRHPCLQKPRDTTGVPTNIDPLFSCHPCHYSLRP